MTFTTKAAAEMRERLEGLGPEIALRVSAGTIHAFCLDLLRNHAEAAGLPNEFAIAAPGDADFYACRAWPEASPAERRILLDRLSSTKSLPGETAKPDFIRQYDELLLSRGLIDFDTVLQKCHELLRGNPPVLTSVQHRFPFVFVDEYQDISGIQHAIIRLIAGESGSVTAIGDPHQSIYGFRGSDVRFFTSFPEHFPGAGVMALTENYRTGCDLIAAFGQVIAKASASVQPLTAATPRAGRLVVHEAISAAAEAEYVVHEIEQLVGGTSMFSHDSGRVSRKNGDERGFREVAVLYRTQSLRRDLEAALLRSGIPYFAAGEKPFHSRNVPSALLGLLHFSSGKAIPPQTLGTVLRRSIPAFEADHGLVLLDRPGASTGVDPLELGRRMLEETSLTLSLLHRLDSFLQTASGIGGQLSRADLEQAVSAGLKLIPPGHAMPEKAEDEEVRLRLLRIARLSSSLQEFADLITLQREEDELLNHAESVSLLTLHASKGLEWPVVFIIGCEEGSLPLESEHGAADVEEERRLLYVGMSRARELLYLTGARRRFGVEQVPSRFLADIEDGLKNIDTGFIRRRTRPDSEQLSLF